MVQAIVPRPVTFPRDTGAHAVSVEWWYFVGHLADASGHSYGFESTFFKFSGLQRYFPGSAVDTVYRTDVAITDEAGHRFDDRVSYTPMGTLGATAGTATLDVRALGMAATTTGPLRYHLRSTLPGGAIDLSLTSLRPPMLVHGGFLGWGLGYTYYYSLTHLQAGGTLTIGGRRIAVHGLAWHDHQWGDMGGSSVRGWDWMALQFDDHSDISLVNERPLYPRYSRWAMALLPDNRQQYASDAVITPLPGHAWRSPITGVRYPMGWHVRVPSLQLDVIVQPTIPNQEVVDNYPVKGYRSSYWEGSCVVSGTRAGHRVSGKAYTELTGYGGGHF